MLRRLCTMVKIPDLESCSLTIYDVKDQLKQFIYDRSSEAIALGEKQRDNIKSKQQLVDRQAFIRDTFIKSIGGIPSYSKPPQATVTGIVECDGFVIEKIIFESRPNVFVSSNLYLPEGMTSPRGAVLFLSGHHDEAKHHPEYQTVC